MLIRNRAGSIRLFNVQPDEGSNASGRVVLHPGGFVILTDAQWEAALEQRVVKAWVDEGQLVEGDELEAESEASDLDDLASPAMAEKLREAGFDSLQSILDASPEELMQVPGVGEKTAKELIVAAKEAGE